MSPEFRAGESARDIALTCTECGNPAEGNSSWSDGSGAICDACTARDSACDLGTIVAQAILAGDVDRAHREAGTRRTWSVPEARAIIAACQVARDTFAGCSVSFRDFL